MSGYYWHGDEMDCWIDGDRTVGWFQLHGIWRVASCGLFRWGYMAVMDDFGALVRIS